MSLRARALPLAFASGMLLAQVPLTDLRNTYTPGPNTAFELPVYQSRSEWEARRAHLKRQILSSAGLLPLPEHGPVPSRIVWRATLNGVAVETVLLETLPGYYVGANIYLPLNASGRAPAVLVPHGHWKRGRLENQASYSVPALCINLARQGYAAIAWDMAGYNDTRQTPHDFGGWREQLWSFNPMGLQLWNSIRVVGYAQSRPEVDPDRIAVTGASGGGTQTFLLSAVDDRLRAAAPVNMISAHMQGGDPCEEAPGLRLGTCNVEFAAMMAPRPLLIVSASGDWTKDTPRVEFPAVQGIYALYGPAGRIWNRHFDAPHNYNRASREAVYPFLARHLLRRSPADLSDSEIDPPADDDLLALRHISLPEGALDYSGVFELWRRLAREQTSRLPACQSHAALRAALGVEWPRRIVSVMERERLIVSRANRSDRVPGIWIPGREPASLVIDPDGADAARQKPAVDELIRKGQFVYLIDAFQTGSAVSNRDRRGDWFLSYNRTDDAHRVQDVLTALAFLTRQTGGRPRLAGYGKAALWCLFAAAAAPVPVDLDAVLNGFKGTDEEFRDQFFVPGIQRAGGLAAALRLTSMADRSR